MRDFSFRSYGFLPFGKRDKGERELNLKEQLTESHERRINPLKQLICVTFRGVTWGVLNCDYLYLLFVARLVRQARKGRTRLINVSTSGNV